MFAALRNLRDDYYRMVGSRNHDEVKAFKIGRLRPGQGMR